MSWQRKSLARALATLGALTSYGVAFEAQAQSFANVGALTARGRDVGVAVDSVGIRSGLLSSATGTLLVQVPPGATVDSASLFTFVRYRSDVVPPTMLPASVSLNGRPVINGGAPLPMSVPAGASPRCVTSVTPSVCFFTVRSDVTGIVAAARSMSVAAALSLSVVESGDSPQLPGGNFGDLFALQGHAIVVLYRSPRPSGRERFVGVWAGTADEMIVDLPALLRPPPLAVCPPMTSVADRDERVVVSTTVLSEENVCGESNEIQFGFSSLMPVTISGIGGADDGGHEPVDMARCADGAREADLRALVTSGSFGGVGGTGTSLALFGRPIGVDGDQLSNGPIMPRRNDELFTLDAVPSRIRLTQGLDPDTSPLKSLGLVVMQYPVDGDADMDGHSDVSEGICSRIDTDRDALQREDWDDPDSDNDCILDSDEVGIARTTVATVNASDEACRARAPTMPICDPMRGECVACSISCAMNPIGGVCRRLPSAGLGCGCFSGADCPMGTRCSSITGLCARESSMDAGAPTDAGAADVGVAEVGAGDVGAAEVGGGDAADERSAANDGAASGDGSSSMVGPVVPRFGGGACQCRATAVTAPRSGLTPVAIGVALSIVAARRRRVASAKRGR